MSPAAPAYTIIARSQVTQWDAARREAVEGWTLTVKWESTGTILNVFVPLAQYVPDKVDTAIRAAGVKDEAIEALGG